MTSTRFLPLALSLLTAAVLAACSSMPASNAQLERTRSAFREAQADTQVQNLASAELRQAREALARAESTFAQGGNTADVDQLAYLALQQTAVAQAVASRKAAEAAVSDAGAERDRLRLAARTAEADKAVGTAAQATRDAAGAQRQAAASQQQTAEAERRNQALQAQLLELQARPTERGMVITIGDVLFDSGRADMRSGGSPNLGRLGEFLKQNPQRKVLIEGYTDSVGGELANQTLSGRRADAVMAVLLQQGVARGQLAAQGYGEAHPVAANDSASGRQMNRRVEIVLSDEGGVLIGR